jgi:signal transduction histidine kinase
MVEDYELHLKFRRLLKERELLVSHDLRTPLTVVKGFTELVLLSDKGHLTEFAREGLQIALRNINKLEQSIYHLEVLLEEAAKNQKSNPLEITNCEASHG